jgi:hypothetical protein
MENQMDKLFKDKLESHSLPPSEDGWSKVEAKLSKKNNAIAWRIAAAILLMGSSAALIYWSHKSDVPQSIAIDQSKKPNNPAVTSPLKKAEPAEEAVMEKRKISKAPTIKKKPTTPSVHLPDQKEEEKTLTPSTIELQKTITVALVNENKPEEKMKSEATSSTKVASTAPKPIKLEFTLDDLTSEEKTVATGEVKNSGLKRVLELAREVKNGEGPIREMKNDLFALNFKKNKTISQQDLK